MTLSACPAKGQVSTLGVTETERIRAHLEQVEVSLREADTSALSEHLRAARRLNLDRLHTYWVRGSFPSNLDFPGVHVPYFIDATGTPCAMAELVIESGARSLAERIASTVNHVWLPDTDDPELLQWVARSGLTLDECARIQPTYCEDACWGVSSPVCGGDGRVYENACYAECAGAGVCSCTGTPVCGTDGMRYPNDCQLRCAGTEIAEGGSCDGEAASLSFPCDVDGSATLSRPLGAPCRVDEVCASGLCIDGVCCDEPCWGPEYYDDCLSCAVPGYVGICSLLPAGSTCRPPMGRCDVAEVCDGVSPDCPSDLFADATLECQTSTCSSDGYVTPATKCSGTSPMCPIESFDCGRLCNSGKCRGCLNDSVCPADSFCIPEVGCLPKRANGERCAGGSYCLSGHCVDGFCCDTACGDGSPWDCQACDVGGHAGQCALLGVSSVCGAPRDECDLYDYCQPPLVACPERGPAPDGTWCLGGQCRGGVCVPATTSPPDAGAHDGGVAAPPPLGTEDGAVAVVDARAPDALEGRGAAGSGQETSAGAGGLPSGVRDGSLPDAAADDRPTQQAQGGCACRSTRTDGTGDAMWSVLVALAGVLRRRRR